MSDHSETDNLALGLLYLSITVYPILMPAEDDVTEPWSPVREAQRRLEAVSLLVDTTEGLQTGLVINAEPVYDALQHLQEYLEEVLEVAKKLEGVMVTTGLSLDPRLSRKGKVVAGRRGPRTTIFSHYVKLLLMRRFPEWDGNDAFPGENSTELRESLRVELRVGLLRTDWTPEVLDHPLIELLTGPPFFAEMRDLLNMVQYAYSSEPFMDEDIDPRVRGPLWTIINNLQRLQ
jgi:hypothetical protein